LLICIDSFRPPPPIGVDFTGFVLKNIPPIGLVSCLVLSFAPFIVDRKFNLFHSFIIHIFYYGFERNVLWLVYCILSFIFYFEFLLISLAGVLLSACIAIMYTQLIISWEKHLFATTNTRCIMKGYWYFSVLRVFNTVGQDAGRIITPIFIASAYLVTLVTNVIIITMYHRMITTIYFLFFELGVLFLAFTMSLMRIAAKSDIISERYIKKLKILSAGKNCKQIRKKVKALQKIIIAVGDFYSLNMGVVLQYGDHIAHSTITVLLMGK